MCRNIVILLAIVQGCFTYQYQSPIVSYNPGARADFLNGGLAQGYIRYVDADGSQRLVGYSYPEPVYTVHRLSFDSQKQGSNPLLKTSVQPGYIEQEYIYQDGQSGDGQAAREQHFRAWNLQRYQALKTEVDKMFAVGQTPSADMLARLKQLEDMSANAKQAVLNETPEVKQAREEHLRLWNEARLKVLQLESEQAKQPIVYHQKPHAGEVVESAEQQKAREEHLRLYNEQLLRIRSFESETQPIHQQNRFALPQEAQTADVNPSTVQQSGVMETPEVQRAKAEHLRLWHEAKQRAEEADKLNSVLVAAPKSNLQAPQKSNEGLKQLVNSVFQQSGQVHQAKFLINDQQAQQDIDNAEAERLREKAGLEVEQLREMQRINDEDKRLELERFREAERLKQEERQMVEERQRLRAEDEKRLRYDLNAQFLEEKAPKVANEIVTPAGVYVLANNQYERNPFLFRFNTNVGSVRSVINSGQPTYYSIPGARAAFSINSSGLQLPPNVLQYNDKPLVPIVKSSQASDSAVPKPTVNDAQALSELEKATREHFRAHEEALKQLNKANQKSAAEENCN